MPVARLFWGAKAVVADLRPDAGRRGAPTDHRVGVGLGQGSAGERARDSHAHRNRGIRGPGA
jgi:hypothetical protein